MRKILLNKYRGKESVNKENIIPVEINRDVSVFHDETMVDTVNTLNVYLDEKNKSSKHRFIFTLYPIFTNILFNKITEIVYMEGSKDTKVLKNQGDDGVGSILKNLSENKKPISTKDTLTRKHCIRNTEYSNSHFNLTYHCGADIFNNHLLRQQGAISVQAYKESNAKCYIYDENNRMIGSISNPFNTIGDFSRTYDGKNIIIPMSTNDDYIYKDEYKHKKTLPLYQYDTINGFKDAYAEKIKRNNGWIGFTNPTTMQIPIKPDYYINKCLNNVEGCSFIDMTPERDLFDFAPKINGYRNRLEHNWLYYLTYPFESEYNDGQILTGKGNGLPLAMYNREKTYNIGFSPSNSLIVTFCSHVKHNLSTGDDVRIIFDKNTFDNSVVCEVVSLGDVNSKNKEYYFSIRLYDLDNFVDNNDSLTGKPIRFSKVVDGFDCEYYFRKFKIMGDYKYSINNLGFAKTIYDDNVGQIVFTSDIDIKEFKNNRGYPLTEVYLTMVKTNKGHKEWYEDNDYKNANIEYSHVFGEVSSGLDILTYGNKNIPCIREQHNINESLINELKVSKEINIPLSSSKLETDISDTFDVFYGDLVEFNPISITETVIENIYHRFNTAQRETSNSEYQTIYFDEIHDDIYDSSNNNTSENKITNITEYELNNGYANLAPEGYIYNPHYRIKVNELSNNVIQFNENIITTNDDINCIDGVLTFSTNNNYDLMLGDLLRMVDGLTFKYFIAKIESFVYNEEDNMHHYTCSVEGDTSTVKNENIFIYNLNKDIPEFAYILPDNSGRFLWKEITPPSSYDSDSELYNIPFTNGAFYHHENVIFTLKRQDPFYKHKMYVEKDGKQIDDNFEIPSNEFDISIDDYNPEINDVLCF